MKDKKLHYVYNFLGIEEQHFTSQDELKAGDHTAIIEFKKEKEDPKFTANGTLSITLDGKSVAQGKMRTQPGKFAIAGEGLTVGRGRADSVSLDYHPPFSWTGGEIKNVMITPQGEGAVDLETEAKMKISAA